MVEIIGS